MHYYVIPGVPRVERTNDPERILKAICTYLDLLPNEVVSKCRIPEFVFARQVAYYIFRLRLNMRYMHIAKFFGRDHTTVIHALSSLKDELSVDIEKRNKFYTILNSIK